jgi:HD-GYP domain-containing protein (c-di-GMP phosphodiesterase class II)
VAPSPDAGSGSRTAADAGSDEHLADTADQSCPEASAEAVPAPDSEPDAEFGQTPGPTPASNLAPTSGPAAGDADAGSRSEGADARVYVDRIGFPGVVAGQKAALLVQGLTDATRKRLLATGGYMLLDDTSKASDADLIVVSTRMARGDLSALLATLRAGRPCPLVALVHTGGEPLAVEVMRAGGVGVVAEGNEVALAAYVTGAGQEGSLVETYERQVSQSRAREDQNRGRDDVTDLPSRSAFDQRLVELGQDGDVPRIVLMRVLHLDRAASRLSKQATDLIRRRLAVQFNELTRVVNVELFSLGQSDFAMLSDTLTPNRAELLGLRLAKVAETFAPIGQTLALAVGHAGSEVTSELSTLRELAQRALLVAASQEDSSVVGADALSLGLSSSTELEAAVRMLEFVEQQDPYPAGHGSRVAEYADEIAWHLGYDGHERARIRLAAYLHDIGKVGLPPDAMRDDPTLSDEMQWAYRSHPARSAEYLRVSAGPDVAEAVRGHHERWDGGGFPDGLSGDRIPVTSRIIAVANRFDALRHDRAEEAGRPATLDDAIQRLREEAGTVLDPALVGVAVKIFGRATDRSAAA